MAKTSGLRDIGKTIKLIYNCDNKAFIIRLLVVIISSILPLLSLYVLKIMVDSISDAASQATQNPIENILFPIFLFVAISFATRFCNIIRKVNNDKLSQKLVFHINTLIQDKASSIDVSYFDSSTFYDSFHRAQQECTTRPIRILNDISSIFGSAIFIVGAIIILAKSSPLIVAIIVAGAIPSFIVRLLKAKKTYAWNKKMTAEFRKSNYYSQVLTSKTYANELRAYNLADRIKKKYQDIRSGVIKQVIGISTKFAWYDTVSATIEAAVLLAALIMLTKNTLASTIGIGTFVMLFETLRRGIGHMQEIITAAGDLFDNRLFISNLFQFLELQPESKTTQKTLPFPKQILEGIEFKNVRFGYPNSEKPIFNNLNISIKPNQINIIRGQNGYGKTTIVKLLLRLYDCDEGEITIDGINIKEFDINDLRDNIGVAFQKFVGFNESVAENIAINAETIDPADLENAAKISNADEFINKLPQGYNTKLGKSFGGEELSIGQWQRLAISRAVYDNKKILIFDEPTSWLDTESEKTFNESLKELSRTHTIILTTNSETQYEC